MSNEIETKIRNKVQEFYNTYIENNRNTPLPLEDNDDFRKFCGSEAYIPATREGVIYLGSTLANGSFFANAINATGGYGNIIQSNKEDLKIQVVEQLIAPFLEQKDFSKYKCLELMDLLFERYYFRENNKYFTYGVCQKWVNMAIKYYLVGLSIISRTDIKVLIHSTGYCFFPIDSRMITAITRDYGVMHYNNNDLKSPLPTPSPWTGCNLKYTFVEYWKFLLNKLNSEPTPIAPLIYEILNW